ncbi:unnamed protein product [Moneuplotes crassus]|uniref:Tyrosine-protein phosphatase domain-containing protein n=1 Tax=Euplotes crassus TaxID=5936 RepID=A0AAD1YAY4_EUPCR|nr:unnamed protein product [Moneuplotes crassus]
MNDQAVGSDLTNVSKIEVPAVNIVDGIPQPPPLSMDKNMIGAIKIKDALFIGDELAAQDLEFVVNNKVTHVINCSGRQIANHWEPIGVAYLTFYWLDVDNQVLFDKEGRITHEIFSFIEEAHENGESVLVHSNRGQSRASAVLAVFFMQKYKWTLFKTLEFLNSRRPDLEIRAAFINQLSDFERRMTSQGNGPESGDWNEISDKINIHQANYVENEELLLRNTFLNAQMGPIAPYNKEEHKKEKKNKLQWIDNSKNGNLRTNASEDDLIFKDQPEPIKTHRTECFDLKSIIKAEFRDQNKENLKLEFYKPEELIDEEIHALEKDIQPLKTEDFTRKAKIELEEAKNNDPVVGNAVLGNTMPLPKKNNYFEGKVTEGSITKGLLEKNKKKVKCISKHSIKKPECKTQNFVMEHKKKVKKDPTKRKRSAKVRGPNSRIDKGFIPHSKGLHRKSYSEGIRDSRKDAKKEAKKDVVINCKNLTNVKIQNSNWSTQNTHQYNILAIIKDNKLNNTQNNKKAKPKVNEKGSKKYSQGYTLNKLTKEGILNPAKTDHYVKVIKNKNKQKQQNGSKKRKVTSYEQRYSVNLKNSKPALLSDSPGLYNGNYGERNANLVHQHALSVNIGGGSYNRSKRDKDNLMSKSAGLESFNGSHKFGSLKSTSKGEKIGKIKKSGPIKATIVTSKPRMSKYEHLGKTYKEIPMDKVTKKPKRREKRPHSSTFIGSYKHDKELYNKIMGIQNKTKPKAPCVASLGLKKKNTKRVRSASPGGLKNITLHKPPKSKEPQRIIGGNLYTTSKNPFSK